MMFLELAQGVFLPFSIIPHSHININTSLFMGKLHRLESPY